jgi:hypothetical protein
MPQPVDVYAYGVMLNEMVTMERPYEGNSPEWVMSAGLFSEARSQPLQRRRCGVSAVVE